MIISYCDLSSVVKFRGNCVTSRDKNVLIRAPAKPKRWKILEV